MSALKHIDMKHDVANGVVHMQFPKVQHVIDAGRQLQGFRYDFRTETATVPAGDDAALDKIRSWANDNDIEIGASTFSHTAARALSTEVAGKYQNLTVGVSRDQLTVKPAIFSTEAGEALGDAGFRYKSWGEFKDKTTGQTIAAGSYYHKLLSAKDNVRDLLGQVDGIIAAQRQQNSVTTKLSSENFGPGIAITSSGSRIYVTSPYDKEFSTKMDELGIGWHKGETRKFVRNGEQVERKLPAGRYGDVTPANYDGIVTALKGLQSKHETMVVPPTPTRPGLTAANIAAIARAGENEQVHDAASKVLKAAFSPAERNAIVDQSVPEHTGSSRLAQLDQASFDQLKDGLAHVQQAIHAMEKAPAAEQAAGQEQAHDQEHSVDM